MGLNTEIFYKILKKNNVNFFCGVPDSLLKNICSYITDNNNEKSHIITANEGSAISIAAGYYLAKNEVPLVYMQNSGLGNAINPLTSIAAPEVYGVPMLLMIGWRGEPGIIDEPQHAKKGEITLKLLETMKIPSIVLSDQDDLASFEIEKAINTANKMKSPVAIVVRKGLFDDYKLKKIATDETSFEREKAIDIIVKSTDSKRSVYLGNTGKIGRELYEIRRANNQNGECDFLNIGGMGHTSQIALGIALNTDKKVYCLDGDGALIMHMGGMTSVGQLAKGNLYHILLNNYSHDSVGGQPTFGKEIDFLDIARSCGYSSSIKVTNEEELLKALKVQSSGPVFIEVIVKKGARKDLGRPKESLSELKLKLMEYLKI